MNEILNKLNNPFDVNNNILQIEKSPKVLEHNVNKISRYGLSDKYMKFKDKKYRYLILDELKLAKVQYYKKHIKPFV